MNVEYSFKELLPLVKEVVKKKRVPFIWGPPGVGKSTLGRDVAREIGAELYILDAPLLQPTDYQIAVPDRETKTVQLYSTGFLPQNGPAVVLVEDLPHAKPYQMVPLMQMVLDRRIGTVKFDDNVYFIITGNREEDLANVNPIPSPLLNRLAHFDMKADLEEWIIWAKSNELDERVYQFLNANPQHFIKHPEEGVRAWPTPRSWHALADIIKGLPDNQVYPFALATVGATAGALSAWLKYLRSINLEDIMKTGNLPADLDRAKIFTIVQAVAAKTDKKVLSQYKIGDFWRSLPQEYKIIFLKELIRYKKNGKPDISLLETFIIQVPEAAAHVQEVALS